MNPSTSQKWLQLLSSELSGFESAIIMIADPKNKRLRTIAKWPEKISNPKVFSLIVKQTLEKKEKICLPNIVDSDNNSSDLYSLPIKKGNSLFGILTVKTSAQPVEMQKVILSAMKKSSKWLLLISLRNSNEDDFYIRVVALLAACFEKSSYKETVTSLVTELTKSFKCERVALSEYRSHHSRVIALSNSANFEAQSNLIRDISSCMDESIDQDSPMKYPDPGTQLINRSHQKLIDRFGTGSICTFPLSHEYKIFGSILLLRSETARFEDKDVRLCEQVFSLIAPNLILKKEQERNLISKIGHSISHLFTSTFSIRRLKLKLVLATITLLLAMTILIQDDFRISAPAILEGKIQRVVAAPFSGFLVSASVRAGDRVTAGEVMASLDDSGLKLELAKLQGSLKKGLRELRKAQSTRDLVSVSVLNERVKQIAAEIDLAYLQLDRVNLITPFDGVIIEGDLSQTLGSPVERGEMLFKIAPLEGYRIILKVDEKQISHIKQGQTGTLVLPSMTEQTYPLIVEKITVASKVEDGTNIFRVEASVKNTTDKLRPGMQGVGKILVGRGPLLWNWTHEIVGMIRIWLWTWWP